MSERSNQLENLVKNGKTDQAIELIRSTRDCHDGENFVVTVLREEKSTPELVEAVLEAFLSTRKNCFHQHGYWVHSLSHFTKILWERRMDGWIKKFNEVAFKGANELQDPNCSGRLVYDFGNFAKFNDDPADFGLTPENLRWMDVEYITYSWARIEAGRFESEEAFLRWKLHRPEAHFAFDSEAQTNLVDLDGIRASVRRLQELGADTSEFNGLERDLLIRQLSELEKQLPTTTQDWEREWLEKGIQKTRAALI